MATADNKLGLRCFATLPTHEQMDFLKAYEIAQAKGFTKEEFVPIWKAELFGRQHESNEGPARSHKEYQQQGMNGVMTKQQYDQLKMELNIQLCSLFSQLIEHQEQHRQHIQEQLDRLADQMNCKFELLSALVNNKVDSASGYLKLNFMQEIELLRQDFERVIKEHGCNNNALPLFETNQFHTDDTSLHEDVQFNTRVHGLDFSSLHDKDRLTFQDVSGNLANEEFVSSWQPAMFQLHQQQQQFQDLSHGSSLPESMSTTAECPESEKPDRVISYAQAVTKPCISGSSFELPAVSSGSMARFLPHLDESSQATGPIAKAIGSLASHSDSSRTGAKSSDSLHSIMGNHLTKCFNQNSGLHASSKQHSFTINGCDQFSVSNKHFSSDFIYSSGKPCKARVRVKFDKSGSLVVHVFVSSGEYDDQHSWPLRLSGTGYVWNKSSKRPTQIWQLLPVLCQKPQPSEQIFPAAVCLSTSRGAYPAISYQKLKSKHYAEDNTLTFMWDLDAVEQM